MLTQLQLQGLDDQTIVVITSNHGQEFNETQSNSWGYGNYSTYQVQVLMCMYIIDDTTKLAFTSLP